MKVALVSPYDYAYPGGVIAHISHLKEHLARLGCEVKVLATSGRREPLGDGVIVLGRTFPIPSNGSMARVSFSLPMFPRVKALLQKENFDIVHLHEPFVSALPLWALTFSSSVNVATFHACYSRSFGYYFSRPILDHWFRRLKGRIAVSRPALESISRYFPGHYEVIPNGIDLEHFSPSVLPLEKYQDGKKNILFVGRLEKRKGVGRLLQAFQQVKREFPACRLLVVGPGKLGPRLRRFTRVNNLEEDVEFIGLVPYRELPRYYRTAHILCAPSRGKESFGVVLLEAMALGVPVVASGIDGYSEVVEDGREGLLVNPEDSDALAGALLRLLKDEDLRQEMGARGTEKARGYSWERVAEGVLQYYHRLLNHP